MNKRLTVGVALLSVLLAGRASAAQGILLLADEGKPEWNTLVRQLAAAVDAQRPAEVAFWSDADPDVQEAVDRLVQRGVSAIAAVPLFVAVAPSDLEASVKTSVPLRITAPLNGDPVAAEILQARAEDISTDAAAELLVLVSYDSTGGGRRWVPDLKTAAQQLNLRRRFAGVLTTTVPPAAAGATAPTIPPQVRPLLEREAARGRRILVVPVLTSHGGPDTAIKEQLEGLPHDMAKSALMPDDRLVAWILSRVEGE